MSRETLRETNLDNLFRATTDLKEAAMALEDNKKFMEFFDASPYAEEYDSFVSMVMSDLLNTFKYILHGTKVSPDLLFNIYLNLEQQASGKTALSIEEVEEELDILLDGEERQPSVPIFEFIDFFKETPELGQHIGSIQNPFARAFNQIKEVADSEGILQLRKQYFKAAGHFNDSINKADPTQDENMKKDKDSKKDPNALKKDTEKLLNRFGVDISESVVQAGSELCTPFGKENHVKEGLIGLSRPQSPLLLFSGEKGSGIENVIGNIAIRINMGNSPKAIDQSVIHRLKLGSILTEYLSTNMTRKTFEEFLQDIGQYNKTHDDQIILYIDEWDKMISDQNLAMFLPLMENVLREKDHGLRIVGSIPDRDLPRLQKIQPGLSEMFDTIQVEPANEEQALQYVANYARQFEANHDVTLSGDLQKRIVRLAARYLPELGQPGGAIKIAKKSCERAVALDNNEITSGYVHEVVSKMCGLPVEMISGSRSDKIMMLGDKLPEMVMGQDGVKVIPKKLKIANAGLNDEGKPLGSFLFTGPTGVGKTETAKAISEILDIPLVEVDMANLSDKHAKSKLIGSPPGYVGYKDPTVLDPIAKAPYSVLLFDEIEKADPEVWNLLMSILEEGRLQMSDGRTISFKDTIVIFTSNAGAAEAKAAMDKRSIGFGSSDNNEEDARKEQQAALRRMLKPEHMNRLDGIVDYGYLTKETVKKIALSQVEKLAKKLNKTNDLLSLELSDAAQDELFELGYNKEFGARPMKRAIEDYIKLPVSEWILTEGQNITEPVTLKINLVKDFNMEVVKTTKKSLNAANDEGEKDISPRSPITGTSDFTP
ncbi:MAG: hypothetical protein CMH28_05355 [Micavibrio sp.]|nr:hypothetical protein [Micavibrio sp.]